MNAEGELIDRFSALREPALSQEGFRIWWFHSTRKAELDAVARTGRINRATAELTQLQDRLYSPKATSLARWSADLRIPQRRVRLMTRSPTKKIAKELPGVVHTPILNRLIELHWYVNVAIIQVMAKSV